MKGKRKRGRPRKTWNVEAKAATEVRDKNGPKQDNSPRIEKTREKCQKKNDGVNSTTTLHLKCYK